MSQSVETKGAHTRPEWRAIGPWIRASDGRQTCREGWRTSRRMGDRNGKSRAEEQGSYQETDMSRSLETKTAHGRPKWWYRGRALG